MCCLDLWRGVSWEELGDTKQCRFSHAWWLQGRVGGEAQSAARGASAAVLVAALLVPDLGTRERSTITVQAQGFPRFILGVAWFAPTAPQSLLQWTASAAQGVSSLARGEFGTFLGMVF